MGIEIRNYRVLIIGREFCELRPAGSKVDRE